MHFPTVSLPCQDGRMIQANSHTLGQILDDFEESVGAYLSKRRKLPSTFASLETETKAAPLPLDPWGSAWHWKFERKKLQLLSLGPDKKLGSADDQEILTMTKKKSNHILAFKNSNIGYQDDYNRAVALK